MKKVLVFSLIFALTMVFLCTLVCASDVNMNLLSNSGIDSTVYGSDSNTNSNTNTNTNTNNTVAPAPTTSPNTNISVGSTGALSSSNLTLSNILNIILIVLGILLVLFAIAILTRIR